MDTFKTSDLTTQRYRVEHTDRYEDYKTDYYVFNIGSVNYWAGVHQSTVDNEYNFFVLYERNEYHFRNLEDAICFSLGGSIAEHYGNYQLNYETSEVVDRGNNFVDALIRRRGITEKQANKLRQGVKEYAEVWL